MCSFDLWGSDIVWCLNIVWGTFGEIDPAVWSAPHPDIDGNNIVWGTIGREDEDDEKVKEAA